jgi:hypothetical protein
MDRSDPVEFEDLEGNIDAPTDTEVELEDIKEEDDVDIEVAADPGEDNEQPEEETEEESSSKAREGQEESDQDDLLSYSKKVRKRIERERKIARAAKAEAEALRQQLDAIQAERQVSVDSQQIDATLTEKRAALKKIREEFDPERVDDELKLLEEITDLQAQKRHLGARGTPPAQRPQAPANPHVAAWLKRNQGWFDKPEYSAQSAVARQIDQALVAEGYSPGEAGYFEEMDRRLAKVVRLPTRAKPTSPVAPVTEGATVPKTKVVLSRGDLAFMEKMGMDTKNPKHLKAFAAERRRSAMRNSNV